MARLTVFANPTKGRTGKPIVQSTRVVSIVYVHADHTVDQSIPYEHKFSRGVTMQLLPDGSVRLYRPDRRPLFREFR
jgi:hypothetical protein